MTSNNPLFQAIGLCYKEYGPINLSLKAGECIAIQGPSGTGKSLLLKVLADLIPHEGELYLAGRGATTYEPHLWRQQVGLLFATSQWWAPRVKHHFTKLDEEALALLGLKPELLEQPPSLCSSGQLQRLALLRLLANEPKVLLLDEPTAHLDEISLQKVEQLIQRYLERTQAAVIWVSHNQQQVIRMASHQYHLIDGTLSLVEEGK